MIARYEWIQNGGPQINENWRNRKDTKTLHTYLFSIQDKRNPKLPNILETSLQTEVVKLEYTN